MVKWLLVLVREGPKKGQGENVRWSLWGFIHGKEKFIWLKGVARLE